MAKHHKIFLILYLGIAIASITLLSTGLSELDFQSGRPLNLLGLLLQRIGSVRAAPPTRWDTGDTSIDVLRVIFWIALFFSIIYAIGSSRFRRQVLRTFLTVIFFVLILWFLVMRMLQEPSFAARRSGVRASLSTSSHDLSTLPALRQKS